MVQGQKGGLDVAENVKVTLRPGERGELDNMEIQRLTLIEKIQVVVNRRESEVKGIRTRFDLATFS